MLLWFRGIQQQLFRMFRKRGISFARATAGPNVTFHLACIQSLIRDLQDQECPEDVQNQQQDQEAVEDVVGRKHGN